MIHPLWYLCIFTRFFLTFNLANYPNKYKIIKFIILIIGIGFGYKAFTGSNDEIQIAKVFWHKTRIIHSFLFLLAFSMPNLKLSSIVLLFDIMFSIIYRIYNL